MARVAGHEFDGIGSDQKCTIEGCDRWWNDIRDCDESHIGKSDIAHSGALNAAELEEIRQKRQYELRFWSAIEGVCRGV